MTKKKEDLIIGCVLVIFSLIYFIASFGITKVDMGTLDSSVMPRVYACILFLLSLILILTSIKKTGKEEITIKTRSDKEIAEEKDKSLSIVKAVILLGVSIFLLGVIGFIPAMSIYMFVSFCFNTKKEERKYPFFAILSIVTAVVVYFIFTRGFQLLLPNGIFA